MSRLALTVATTLLPGCHAVFGLDELVPEVGSRVDAVTDQGSLTDMPDEDMPPPAACPPTYTEMIATSDTFYRRGNAASWWDAELACEADQAMAVGRFTHLAVLGDDGERQRVYAKLNMGSNLYVGLSKAPPPFHWVTGEATTYPPSLGPMWEGGGPDIVGGADYVLLHVTDGGTLENTNGMAAYAYVCECDMHPVQ